MLTNRNSFLVRFIMLLLIIVIRGGDSAADRSVFNATNIIRSSSRWMLSYPGFDEETTGV